MLCVIYLVFNILALSNDIHSPNGISRDRMVVFHLLVEDRHIFASFPNICNIPLIEYL